MQKAFFMLASLLVASGGLAQQTATIKEYNREFKTYPFSDPDPIPKFGLIYPYYRFDGYTDKPVNIEWKVVELENDYIKVMILPEIGGKIWTAIEKSTGKPFIYFNQVVKFRDIAMRGAWTSGGIEANYGIIGHTPNCSTPVDYWKMEKSDGSVSCFIGTLDLLTQTYWTMEINLPKDKAYFTTRSFWHNSTSVEQPYYTWMNAGIKASGNLQFIYPGNRYLGHNGEYDDWPINAKNGKDISFYENNNFGQYKSYHVFGQYTDFFGGYWHNEDFGMGRYAAHSEKPGKKIWIWGLSEQGMIWEKLLTDADGQYVEVQSGRLYNQTAELSTFTPFKHRGFAPYATDEWTEYWFPVKGTQGFVQANPYGSLNAVSKDKKITLAFSPLQSFSDEVKVMESNRVLYSKKIDFKVLQPFSDSFPFSGDANDVVVHVGDKVVYEFNAEKNALNRPVDSPKNFEWTSAYGLWLQGKEFIRSRNYKEAERKLNESLAKNPYYLPALCDMSLLMNIGGLHQKAFEYGSQALQVDTYDPAANYYYALASLNLAKTVDAKDGFDIALQSIEFRGPAATELSKIYFKEKNYSRALTYALISTEQNKNNVTAFQLQVIIHRVQKNERKAKEALGAIASLNPLNHFQYFENYLWNKSEENKYKFISMIRNEMAWETYLQLGIEYYSLGQLEESMAVLSLAPENPEIYYWIAFIREKHGEGKSNEYIQKGNSLSPYLVFPFRSASKEVMSWVVSQSNHWKPKYYLGLISRHVNQLHKAKELFTACGDTPDFAPFYAARANLMNDKTTQIDLRKASQLEPDQWRYGKLLITYYLDQNNTTEAVRVARQYNRKLPANYMVSMLLAKSLLYDGQFGAASKILATTKILPYEGATESRMLYREAWLMQALNDIQQKKYKNALTKIQSSRRWPENLGVGKPYDDDIDDRIEDYVESICYEKMKNTNQAEAKWNEIVAFEKRKEFNVSDLISAEAYRKTGRPVEGRALLTNWVAMEPTNSRAKWSLNLYDGKIDKMLNSDDSNFRLIKALLITN